MVQHHLAKNVPRVPARPRVVTQIHDALRRKQIAAERHETVANVGRNPRIESVRDDVVELAGIPIEIAEILLAQTQRSVASNRRWCDFPPATAARRKVHADKTTRRKKVRHRNQVAAVAAADFEHAAGRHGRGVHPKQRSNGGETVGMSLDPRVSRIANRVVRAFRHEFSLWGNGGACAMSHAALERGQKTALTRGEYG